MIAEGYRFKKALEPTPVASDEPDRRMTQFWSWRWGRDVFICDDDDGNRTWGMVNPFNRLTYDISTLGASVAWSLTAEQKACEKLAQLIKPNAWKAYMLTGTFLETSERSRVTYMFRRLKPTVAMSGSTGEMRVLCALCLHPIGYYAGSWAGCMVPTDDVIAHLLLMRGDEHMFWKRSNQHPAHRKESGL